MLINKALIGLLVVLHVSMGYVVAAPESALSFKIESVTGVKSEPQVIEHSIDLSGLRFFTLRDSNKKLVPSWYDKDKQKLYFYDVLEAEGNAYSLSDSRSQYQKPAWKGLVLGGDAKVKIGDEVYARKGFEFDNGAFKVSIPLVKELPPPVVIESKTNPDYTLRFFPLGFASGNIMDPSHAEGSLNSEKLTKNIFSFNSGVPKGVVFSKINDFQAKITVDCDTILHSNENIKDEVIGDFRIEVFLTWKSPVIKLKCYREYHKDFYNHNGHNLNSFQLETGPITAVSDLYSKPMVLQAADKTHDPFNPEIIQAWQSFELGERKGKTVFSFPAFRENCIYRPIIPLVNGVMLTTISQSGGEGWLPVLQKAGTYEDLIVLVCDTEGKGKELKDWLAELEIPLASREQRIMHELKMVKNRAQVLTFYNKKNAEKTIRFMTKKGKQEICKRFGITLQELAVIEEKLNSSKAP